MLQLVAKVINYINDENISSALIENITTYLYDP